MVDPATFQQLNPYEWQIPSIIDSNMRTSVRLFASREILNAVSNDRSIQQAMNVASLPSIVGDVIVMPDMHQGYGFPIGGIAATDYPQGVISPGGIGYDINCGVRLLASSIRNVDIKKVIDEWAYMLYQACPSGVGSDSDIKLSDEDLAQVCLLGSKWAHKKGMASEKDIRRTEEEGTITGADPLSVSRKAFQRGRTQLGTLGSGNHFLEVDVVERVFDETAAHVMGLHLGCLAIQIHCGSRGFGHQICTDYVQRFQGLVTKYQYPLPDRELVYAPLNSSEGHAYHAAMAAAANFAFCNRQILAHKVRIATERVLAGKVKNAHFYQVYDVAHNIGKIESHIIDGVRRKVFVHRKGATRAFGPGSSDIPPEYKGIGQPVLVPGSMGTASWVLAGTEVAMQRSFGSCCHGAGRRLSRSEAQKKVRSEELLSILTKQGITIRAQSMRGLAEEAPDAYKDVDAVIECVVGAGLAIPVARMKPLIVVKG